MLSGRDNSTSADHLTFLSGLELWCKERETYPSRLRVRCANTLTDGMIIQVEAQPQKDRMPPTEDRSHLLSSHILIDETLTESAANRLTGALQAIHDQQGLVFRQGLCYMMLLYLASCDLERTQEGQPSLLLTNRDVQREEHNQDAILPLWSLDDVLQFWDTFDGRLNQGFPPPGKNDKGRWSYKTVPPCWLPDTVPPCELPDSELPDSWELPDPAPPRKLPDTVAVPGVRRREGYRWTMLAEDHRSVCFAHEEDRYSVAFEGTSTVSPPSVPVMVPAPWKNWVENLVALLRVPAQHGVHINISLGTAGAAVAESQTEYVEGKNIFRQKGEVWDIVYQGRSFSLKNIKGLHYVKFLLRHPTKKFTPRQLSEGIGESVPAKGDRAYSSMSEPRLEELGLRSSAWDTETIDAETMVDEQTVAQCRQKLADLTEQKEEAERYHDYERVAHLEDEMDVITAYLTNTTFRGKSKKFQIASDKIRTSITKRIHDAINKIRQQDDSLARQLHNCIKTGNQCSYDPDPQNPITWSF